MHRLTSFHSAIEAWATASYLWKHGVPASVFVPPADAFGMPGMFRTVSGDTRVAGGIYEVFIAERKLEPDATRLLQQMADQPASYDPDWELTVQVPDLSRLNDSVAQACPSCTKTLPMDPLLERCPSCDAEVDVVELIVARHGPEMLASCYPEPEFPVADDVLFWAPVPCPKCAYQLAGLDIEGACPECGKAYNKQLIFRQWFG